MITQARIKAFFVLVFAVFVGYGGYLSYNIFTAKKSITIQTPYGTYSTDDPLIDDPLIIELIESPAVQRTKNVSQHGIVSFIKSEERPYSRYEHSVGVWALLKRFGAPRKQQVAGLLHDVSHTVFSHVGDYVFRNKSHKTSYQDNIHTWYLEQTGVCDILKKYNFSVHDMNIEHGDFTMLDQEYPDLCIDRLEYNLRVGPWVGLIEEKDIEVILQDLSFESSKWFFKTPEIARKFCAISLYFTQHVWGGPENYIIESLAAHMLRRTMQTNFITKQEIHFSTDDSIWKRLTESGDYIIQKIMALMKDYKNLYVLGSHGARVHCVKTKFRGIDPLVKQPETGQLKRLSELDQEFAQDYERVKTIVKNGWLVLFTGQLATDKELINQAFA